MGNSFRIIPSQVKTYVFTFSIAFPALVSHSDERLLLPKFQRLLLPKFHRLFLCFACVLLHKFWTWLVCVGNPRADEVLCGEEVEGFNEIGDQSSQTKLFVVRR